MSRHTKASRRAAFRAHHADLGAEAIGEHNGRGLLAFLDAIRPAVMDSLDAQNDAPCDREGIGWHGTLGGACPLQGDGVVDELPWYFRARGASWGFGVAATSGGDPVEACFGSAPEGSFYAAGEAEGDGAWSGSWMPHSEAWRHIEASIAAFRAARGA